MAADANCPHCGGTGWRQLEQDGVSQVARCECREQQRQKALLARAGIPERFAAAGFDTFRLPTQSENPVANLALTNVMIGLKAYTREYPSPSKMGLMLAGPTGVGKTHLATAVLRELTGRGFECLFFDYQNLLDRIRQGYDKTAGTSDKRAYRSALDTEIVLLDDLGSHRVSDWVVDTVTAIINHRYNTRKALIVTTNLPDPAFGEGEGGGNRAAGSSSIKDTLADRIGGRARSRLFEMCRVIRIRTHDHRLSQAQVY